MFRTYVTSPKTKDVKNYCHAGPDPANCKISLACAATGAAQYFLKPCKIGGTSYFDADFPHPHRISSLALDEAYSIFGSEVPLSLILNVGPSIANESDLQQLKASSSTRVIRIARKFSWPKIAGRPITNNPLTRENLSAVGSNLTFQERANTSSSLAASDTEKRLRTGIKERLMREYKDQQGDRLYHRLGPVGSFAPERLSLNDVSEINLSHAEVETFRKSDEAGRLIKEAAQQYTWVAAPAA